MREGARRQHRIVSLFAAIQCWVRDLDGVVLQRDHLERLIGLERIKGKRQEWLKEDLKDLFPHQFPIRYSKSQSFASLFVSRSPLNLMPRGTMNDEERIQRMPKEGPRIGVLMLWPKVGHWAQDKLRDGFEGILPIFTGSSRGKANYDERVLALQLVMLFQGQMSPKALSQTWKAETDSED